jgi:HEAT repeat protein
MTEEEPVEGAVAENAPGVEHQNSFTPEECRIALTSADAEARRQAIERAASGAGPEFDALFVAALADIDWRVRTEAVRSLSARELDPTIAERLVDVLLNEADVGFRNAAVDALGGGGETSVRALSSRMAMLDADGRKLAADAMARTSALSAIAPLAVLASDSDANVCAAAIEAVARVARREPERAQPLIERALGHNDHFVRLVCLDAAHALGLKLSWDVLARHLNDPALAQTALELAATMDEPRAAPYFARQLEVVTGKAWLATLGALRVFARRSRETNAAAREALERLPSHTLNAVAQAARPGSLGGADALLVLCLRGGSSALQCFDAWLGLDEHWDVVREAVTALGAPLVPRLLSTVSMGEGNIQMHALELLVQLAAEDALREQILAGARPKAPSFGAAPLRVWLGAVARWGNEADFREVFERWGGPLGPALRRAAVVATESCARRFPELARELVTGVDAGSVAAAGVVVVIGAAVVPVTGSTATDRDFLVRALSNTNAAVRVHALEAMSNVPALSSEEALGFALNDDAPEVQTAAVRATGALSAAGLGWARDCLLQLVSSSAHVSLAVTALQALSGSRDPILLSHMDSLLSHRDAWRAAAAVGALRGYPPADRLPALRQALTHPDAGVVKSAVELLVADEHTVDDLQGCLSHPVWDVRRAAADQLGSGPSEMASVALTQRLAEEKEPLVVEAIYRSLSQLAGHRPVSWRVRQTTPEPGS